MLLSTYTVIIASILHFAKKMCEIANFAQQMCEKWFQGKIIHKVNKISRLDCGLFIKFARVSVTVAFVKSFYILPAAHNDRI